MVRNLMLILGLSLTLAAFGCSSDDGGTGGGTAGTGGGGAGGDGGTAGGGGAAGGGGNGGGGGTVTGACTMPEDVAIICDESFTAAATTCGTENILEGPEAIAACIAEDTGLNVNCATCFGETTQCTIDNCIEAGCAVEPMGQSCTMCRAENCDPAFNACAGEFDCGA
jgi:hypothetical protein